jgi:hypothetical protein
MVMRRAANDVDVGVDGADIGHWYCRVIGMLALVMDELPEVVAAEKRDELRLLLCSLREAIQVIGDFERDRRRAAGIIAADVTLRGTSVAHIRRATHSQ